VSLNRIVGLAFVWGQARLLSNLLESSAVIVVISGRRILPYIILICIEQPWVIRRGNSSKNSQSETLREISKEEWKKASGYHRRSLAETVMFRFKCLFSGNLKNRRFDSQVTEAHCRVLAMNKMTFLGMPHSVLQGDSA
jgi:hypothetical protein